MSRNIEANNETLTSADSFLDLRLGNQPIRAGVPVGGGSVVVGGRRYGIASGYINGGHITPTDRDGDDLHAGDSSVPDGGAFGPEVEKSALDIWLARPRVQRWHEALRERGRKDGWEYRQDIDNESWECMSGDEQKQVLMPLFTYALKSTRAVGEEGELKLWDIYRAVTEAPDGFREFYREGFEQGLDNFEAMVRR